MSLVADPRYPAIPEIAQAFQNDPRNRLAQVMINQGSSTAPVAGGKWAWADGIARALQGVAGGYIQGRALKKANEDEKALMAAYADALGGAGAAPPAQAPQSPGNAPPAPPTAQAAPDPLAPLPTASIPPQAAPVAPPAPAPQAPAIAAALGAPKPRLQGASLLSAVLPITRASESNNRDFSSPGVAVTSPKGAKYAMQVMPATARQPGYGIKPAANDSPEEYNRVGTELLGKFQQIYGDPAKAWAAYNWSKKGVDRLVAKYGDSWLDHAPAETQKYVKSNVASLGNTDPSQGAYYGGTDTAAAPATTTPDPVLPTMPTRPQARPAVQSQRLAAGQALMRSGNPYAFSTALKFVDAGMGDQFQADRDALQNANELDKTEYSAGLGDYYGAQDQKRGATYQQQSQERGFAHDTSERLGTEAFQHGENTAQRALTASEGDKDRANSVRIAEIGAASRESVAAQRMNNFLSSPTGARLYQQTTDVIRQNDDINNNITQFMQLNEKNPNTGGFLVNAPGGEFIARNWNSDTQAMDAITNKIAPLMRQAGQGSMSDRDLARFEQSVPNIRSTLASNRKTAARLSAGIKRMNDFEMEKLQAMAEGNQVQFLRDWETFKRQVPFETGKTFQEWKSGLSSYGSDGKRK